MGENGKCSLDKAVVTLEPAKSPVPIEIFETVPAGTPLEQGDILFLCPYLYPIKIDTDATKKEDEREHRIWTQEWNIMILGHSCDIENEKVDLVLICPIWEINSYLKNCAGRYKKDAKYRGKFDNDVKKFKNNINILIRKATEGQAFGYAILKGAMLPEIQTEPLLVDFSNTYTLPLDFLYEFSKTDKNNARRLRLKMEYRIDLIAKFNYFLLRAVLPKSDFDYDRDIKPIINGAEIDKILNEG